VGTVAYMSPEQAEGKPVDHRSDIFSLGVVLYEMATGEKPFKGDTPVSTLSSILRDSPASVSDVNTALPRDLGRIIKRALVKDPEHRYQTAKDLRNELEALKEDIASGSISSPAAAAVSPSATSYSRGQSNLIRGAVALVAIAIVAAIAWFVLKGRP